MRGIWADLLRYADHVYIALTLQKLVHYTPKDEESEIEDILNPKAEKRRGVFSRLFHRNKVEENGRAELGRYITSTVCFKMIIKSN